MDRSPQSRLRALVVAGAAVLAALLPVVPAVADTGPAAPPIVPFEEWADGACPTPTGADPWSVDRIVVHHTHEPVAATPEQVVPALHEICDLHTGRGFDTIGYHYVVDPWGTVWQARGGLPDEDGAPPSTQMEGAHTAGANPRSVGVAFLGDHESTPPTEAAVAAATQLLAWLAPSTGVAPDDLVTVEATGNGTSLVEGSIEVHALDGHNSTNATLCPGQHLLALLPELRDLVATTLAGGDPIPDGTLLAADGVTDAPGLIKAHTAALRPIGVASELTTGEPLRQLRWLPVVAMLGLCADGVRRKVARESST